MAELANSSNAYGQGPLKRPTKEEEKEGGVEDPGLLGSLSFAQFELMTVIIILMASGLVPWEHVACVIMGCGYAYMVGKFVFPPLPTAAPTAPDPVNTGKLLHSFVGLGAIVGLYVPMAYILLGLCLMGDAQAVRAAAPHTFLLACQILSEQIVSASPFISLPMRAILPIFYNAGRLISLWQWFLADFEKTALQFTIPHPHLPPLHTHHLPPQPHNPPQGFPHGPPQDFPHPHPPPRPAPPSVWLYLGPGLALANLLFWSFNLFGFLVPCYLPRAFRRYFDDERVWKERNAKSKES